MVERKLGMGDWQGALQEEEREGKQGVGGREQLCRKNGVKLGS